MNLDNPLDGGVDMVFRVLELTGTTQKDFARSLNISAKHLSEIRHHATELSAPMFRRMWTAAMDLLGQHTQARPDVLLQMAGELTWLADRARELARETTDL